MLGDLFIYDPQDRLAAFETLLPQEPIGTVIFIGGLTDGFLTCPMVEALQVPLREAGISLIQFVMSSSYRQYGTSSLSRDCTELSKLIEFVQTKRGRSKIFLLGHSTGCQDIFHYLRDCLKAEHLVFGANCQAPVSDRDFLNWYNPEMSKSYLKQAEELISRDQADHLLPRMLEGVPMTAQRAHSLLARLGSDDFFSLDLTISECKEKFPSFAVSPHPTFNSFNFSFSLHDEFVPHTETESREQRIGLLIEKLIQCYPFTKEPILLPGNHDLSSNPESLQQFCQLMLQEVMASFQIGKENS